MNYNIYLHNDFDGYSSAAVIYDFLTKNKYKVKNFILVDYHLKKRWPKMKLKENAIILDFYYHPQAKFWFDHHPTTFIKKEWKIKFKKTKYHHWDIKYRSVCSLVIDKLKKYFNYLPSKYIKNLSKWTDIVDGAVYKNPKEAISLKKPACQISAFIENHSQNKPLTWLIKDLISKSLKEIVKKPRVKNFIKKENLRRKKILNFYWKKLKIYNHLGIIYIPNKSNNLRYAPFYLKPDLIYLASAKKNKSLYRLTLSVNPWKRKFNKIHIGNFLRKNFSGGGHKLVGGAEFKNKKELNLAFQKIIKVFSKQ